MVGKGGRCQAEGLQGEVGAGPDVRTFGFGELVARKPIRMSDAAEGTRARGAASRSGERVARGAEPKEVVQPFGEALVEGGPQVVGRQVV